MALINCPECKKDISDQAGSCPSCGYPLNVETPAKIEKKSATRICEECGSEIKEDLQICQKCGPNLVKRGGFGKHFDFGIHVSLFIFFSLALYFASSSFEGLDRILKEFPLFREVFSLLGGGLYLLWAFLPGRKKNK